MSDSETKRSAEESAAGSTSPEATSTESVAESPPASATERTAVATETELRASEPEVGTAQAPEQAGHPPTAGSSTASERPPASQPPEQASHPPASKPTPPSSSRWLDRSTLVWLGVVAVIFAVELFIYGHAGIIRVCVGLEGQTDFSLLERRDPQAPPREHPYCAERRNIGMYPRAEEAAREALDEACQRAAALTRGDQHACIRREQGWVRQVHKQNLPPWDERVYRRLLWLD